MFAIEDLDFREEDGLYFRQALSELSQKRNLPLVYILGTCYMLPDLKRLEKDKQLEQKLREAGAITGWSKERAVLGATLDDTADKFTQIARTY
mgnify:CR=1 FL=1